MSYASLTRTPAVGRALSRPHFSKSDCDAIYLIGVGTATDPHRQVPHEPGNTNPAVNALAFKVQQGLRALGYDVYLNGVFESVTMGAWRAFAVAHPRAISPAWFRPYAPTGTAFSAPGGITCGGLAVLDAELHPPTRARYATHQGILP